MIAYTILYSDSIYYTVLGDTLDTVDDDDDEQLRGAVIGEIIGSFMAGVVVATIIIMTTSEFTRALCVYIYIYIFYYINMCWYELRSYCMSELRISYLYYKLNPLGLHLHNYITNSIVG